MEKTPCTIVFNTKWGYCMTPIECESITEAINKAREAGMAFRIFVNGECVRRGWYI